MPNFTFALFCIHCFLTNNILLVTYYNNIIDNKNDNNNDNNTYTNINNNNNKLYTLHSLGSISEGDIVQAHTE